MNFYFVAKMHYLKHNQIEFGILLLRQPDKMEWLYVYRYLDNYIINDIKKYNSSNIFYCINELLTYENYNTAYFDFKPEYFNRPMTAEEAYEHLLYSADK